MMKLTKNKKLALIKSSVFKMTACVQLQPRLFPSNSNYKDIKRAMFFYPKTFNLVLFVEIWLGKLMPNLNKTTIKTRRNI